MSFSKINLNIHNLGGGGENHGVLAVHTFSKPVFTHNLYQELSSQIQIINLHVSSSSSFHQCSRKNATHTSYG